MPTNAEKNLTKYFVVSLIFPTFAATLGARASSPAMVAGEDARAPRQTAVITVSYIEAKASRTEPC